jgi:hypothetical protein
MTSMVAAPVMMTARFSQRVLAPPPMTTSTPSGLGRFCRTLQMHRDVGAASARARTRPNDCLRPATTTLLARAQSDLTHAALSHRIATTLAPSPAGRLGGSRWIAAATSPTSGSFGRSSDVMAFAPSLGVCLSMKRALTRCDHSCGRAPLSSCTTMTTLLPFPCHWRLPGRRSLPTLALPIS